MKPNVNRWKVVQKGNGKFYPRVENDYAGAYWPWSPSEFDTFEEAKTALIKKKDDLERQAQENKETVVFELT